MRRLLLRGANEPDDPVTPPVVTPDGVSTFLNLHETERQRIREILGLDAHSYSSMDELKTTARDSLSSDTKKYAYWIKWNDGTASDETSFSYKRVYDLMLNDYSSININAQKIVNNPLVGLHTNYDTTNGLSGAISNFETIGSAIYNKESRFIDSSSGGNDRGSWYANDAAFMYMIAGGDNNSINGLKGIWLVGGIHAHLQEYSNRSGTHGQWVNPFNTLRFPRGSGNFRDLNPGFFYATWLNGLLTSYEFTYNSSIWSDSLKRQINAWFMEWANVFYDNIVYNMRSKWGSNWVNDDVSTATGGSWNNKVLGSLWDSGAPLKYGFQEIYANRQVAIMAFIMRCGLFFKDNATHQTRAREYIRIAKQFTKEAIAYAYAYENSNIDLERTDKKARFMQTPIHYAGVAIGGLTFMIDAYERKMRKEPTYENLWEYSITFGNSEWNKYSESGATFLEQVKPTYPKNILNISEQYAKYYQGIYESTRKKTMGGVTEPINGWSGAQRNLCRTQYDRWLLRQSAYYVPNSRNAGALRSAVSVAGTPTFHRKYPVFPDGYADRVGSYQVRLGWNYFNSCWLECGALHVMDDYNFYAQ